MKAPTQKLPEFRLAFVLMVSCLYASSLFAIPPQLGSKKVIVMLVDFPDLTNSAPSVVSVSNAMLSVNSFYQSNSFNQLSITSTVIGTLRMPTNSASYVSAFNVGGLRNDAFTAARAIGFEPTNYDYDIVTFTNIGFSFAGWAGIGGRGLWVQNYASTTPFDSGVTSHELGHNFGLNHAHAWASPTVIGPGVNVDTGNRFDIMGGGDFPISHFNSNFKFQLGWFPTNCIQTVSSNGTYRIYVMDGCGALNVTRKYSLVVPAAVMVVGNPEDYWVECRQLINNASLSNGIVVMWGDTSSTYDCYVLDTTPGSQTGLLDASDCPVTLGRSFTDPNKKITIAPIAKGGSGADLYFDVQVTLNSTSVPPAIAMQPSSQTALAGSNAVISVTGTSSSPINYQWRRYGTSVTGATNAVLSLTNVSATQAGDYTVVLSNSLGSVESSLATLTVTYPPPPSCYPVPQGIVAWWPGDGHPLDWVGTNHGVLQQTASYAQGEVGQAFALNGSTDFVQVPNSSLWAFGTNDFTIELWADFSVVSGDCAFIANDNGGGQQNKWIFWWNDKQLRFFALNANSSADNVGTANFSPTTNQWYHLAVTRVGSTFNFYINGASVSTNTSTISVPTMTVPLTIGESEGGFFFGGLLDEIRIYKRGLSASEILGIYSSGSTGVCWPTNPPAYVEFSTPAATVQEGTGNAGLGLRRAGNTATTVSVNCLSSNGTALAGVNYTSVSNTVTFSPAELNKTINVAILNDGVAGGVKQFNVQLSSPSSNAVLGANFTNTVFIIDNGCLPPLTGLVGWWTGNGTAGDLANADNGTLQNGATFAPGLVGNAFSVNGINSYISVPDSPSLTFAPGAPYSLGAWVFRSNSSLPFHVMGKRDPANANFYQMGYDGNSPNVPMNVWTLLIDTFDGTTYRRYYNGALVQSYPVTPSTNTPPLVPLTIGASGPYFGFQGLIDEAQIYNRALTGSEIQAIYNSGSEGMCPPSPPLFSSQPQSQTVKVGANVIFTANANGFNPLNYQWRVNGTNIVAATNGSLNLTNVQTANAGNYSVVVTNIAGSITSTNATLTVNPPLPTTFQSIKRLPDGRIQLVISGDPGSVNTLQFSTNLFDWQILSNITLPGIPITLTNCPATNSTKGFYRTLSTGVTQ